MYIKKKNVMYVLPRLHSYYKMGMYFKNLKKIVMYNYTDLDLVVERCI